MIDLEKLASQLLCPICQAAPKLTIPPPNEADPWPQYALLMTCDAGGVLHFHAYGFPGDLYTAYGRTPRELTRLVIDFDWPIERIRTALALGSEAFCEPW